jgi:hypothetical protein
LAGEIEKPAAIRGHLWLGFSAATSSNTAVTVIFYSSNSCTGSALAQTQISPFSCTPEIDTQGTEAVSYSVKFSS